MFYYVKKLSGYTRKSARKTLTEYLDESNKLTAALGKLEMSSSQIYMLEIFVLQGNKISLMALDTFLNS